MIIIADSISKSGIPCEISHDLMGYLWGKMLFNCALNPLGAILKVNYGTLIENPFTISIMNNVIDEIFEVIKAEDYKIPWNTSKEYKDLFYSKLAPDGHNHYSSMFQDIENKNKTEIDALNGKVVKLAKKHNIDVPVNKMLYNMIKAIENNF